MTRTGNTLWLTACRLGGDVLNLALFVLVSRRFGPAGVGLYSYCFAIATFAFVIGCLGIEEYGLRQYARLDAALRPTFLSELLGTQLLMVAAATAALAGYLLATHPSHTVAMMVTALGGYQITAALVATLFIPAMAEQRMLWPALAEFTARAAAFLTAGYAIVFDHASLAPALLGFPVAAGIWFCIALVATRRFAPLVRPRLAPASARRILALLWSFALLEIFAQLFSRVGIISLTLIVSSTASGIYATGLRVIEVALMPLSFLGVAAYPALSRQFIDDLPAFRRSAVDIIWFMLLGGCAVSWGLYFVAPYVLVPVLGERFAGAEHALQTMAVLALVQALEIGLGRVLLCADRQTANAAFVAGGASLSVLLNVALVPRFGVDGAIFGATIAYAAIDVLCILALRKPLAGAAPIQMLWSVASSVAIAAAIAAFLAWRECPVWSQAAVSITAFAAIGLAAHWRRHRKSMRPPAPSFWKTP